MEGRRGPRGEGCWGAMGRLAASSSGPRSLFRRATFFYHVNKIFSDSCSPVLAKQTNKPLATAERVAGVGAVRPPGPSPLRYGSNRNRAAFPANPRGPRRRIRPWYPLARPHNTHRARTCTRIHPRGTATHGARVQSEKLRKRRRRSRRIRGPAGRTEAEGGEGGRWKKRRTKRTKHETE